MSVVNKGGAEKSLCLTRRRGKLGRDSASAGICAATKGREGKEERGGRGW